MQAYTLTLIERLDALNQQRVERALSIMDKHSQQVFHLLPVLLHFNHPSLPGFYEKGAPHGIFGFDISDIQHQAISILAETDNFDLLSFLVGHEKKCHF